MATRSNTKNTLSLQLGEFPSLVADSLQTPDTSSLFLSAISNEPDTSLVFQDRTSTITSLEELLNVTGINQAEEINFSEIAREVEAQHGGQGRKRCLSQEDSLAFANSTNGVVPVKQAKMELNLSSQPNSRNTESPSSLHQARISGGQSNNQYPNPVQITAQHSQDPGTRTSQSDSRTSGFKSPSGHANGTSVVTLQSGRVSGGPSNIGGYALAASVPSCASGGTNVCNTSVQLSQPAAVAASVPMMSGMSLKSLSQVHRGNLVLQLVQLYRQYQQLGDTQGMTKVKQQLSSFLSTQNNSKVISSTSQPANIPLPSSVKTHITPTSSQLIGQPRPGTFLGTNPCVSSPGTSFSPAICSANFQPLAPKPLTTSNPPLIGTKPPPLAKPHSVVSTLTSVKSVSSPSIPSNTTAKGADFSASQPGQGKPDLIGQFVPSLLSSLSSTTPSATVSNPSQSQDVLKTMYMYRVKQIQAFMQGLPADQKPRNLTELKDLLKKYNVNFQASDAPAGPSSQLSSTNCGGPLSATTPTSLGSLSQSSVGSTQLSPPISISQKAGIPFLSGQLPFSAKNTPQPSSTSSASLKQTNLNVSGTPGSATTVVTSIPNPRVAVTAAPIQPGMVTPLPPGLNLEALSKLCSLPESELLKHNLPPNLLTAIKVWKLQQKSEPQSSLFKSAEATPTDIPVLMGKEDKIFGSSGIGIPVTRLNLPIVAGRAEPHHSMASSLNNTKTPLDKSSVTKTFADSRDHFAKALAGMQPSLDSTLTNRPSSSNQSNSRAGVPPAQVSNVQQHQQPRATLTTGTRAHTEHDSVMAPLASRVTVGPLVSGDGSSPLLAHLSTLRTQRQGPSLQTGYQGATTTLNNSSAIPSQPIDISKLPAHSTQSAATGSRPLTRYQAKVEHARAEHERIQTIHKILQSSDEAKIAFRIQNHLEKMQAQVVTPDVHTPFKSFQDVLVRLLPYHILSEPEPAPGTMEKADAVVESVAQILMSRSRGLISRYQQLVLKDTQVEQDRPLCIQLDRLFAETEQERIAQEDKEKQQAEQIAADLSLIAGDNMINFDNDFSLGDILNDDPMFSLDPGIT